MVDLITLFIWSIGVFSATNIIVVSKIFYGFRTWLTYKKLEPVKNENGVVTSYNAEARKIQTFSNLVHCPMCLGFWMGILAGIFIFSPTFSILLGDNMFVNYFNDGLLGSMLCWVYYLILNKYQGKS
jgi:hypothetical protein